jgi:hypothetical protein
VILVKYTIRPHDKVFELQQPNEGLPDFAERPLWGHNRCGSNQVTLGKVAKVGELTHTFGKLSKGDTDDKDSQSDQHLQQTVVHGQPRSV